MQSVQQNEVKLLAEVRQQVALSRVYVSNINALKPELKRLSKRRDELKK